MRLLMTNSIYAASAFMPKQWCLRWLPGYAGLRRLLWLFSLLYTRGFIGLPVYP